jgi:P-type Ca2+ transporter type 2C
MTPPPGISFLHRPPHLHRIEELFGLLESSPEGLSSSSAAERLRSGRNELPAPRREHPVWLLLKQFGSILVLILIAAAVVAAVMGETVEASAILFIVVLAGVMGFFQEYQAERALEALQRLTSPQSTVLRDGHPRVVPSGELVPGDVVLLKSGDAVPADSRVFETRDLRVDESALTGESKPAKKKNLHLEDPDLTPGDRLNMVFSGTIVQHGRCSALVVQTGGATELGRIASLLGGVKSGPTPLQKDLDRLGKYLGAFSVILAAGMSILGVLRGYGVLEMFVWGVAVAVAVIPEALPAVVTITLALGVRRMAQRRALIRKLPAVETLGATSVICSDKTGTLTQNEMTVRKMIVGGRIIDVSGAGYTPVGTFSVAGRQISPQQDPMVHRLLLAGMLCNDAALNRDATMGWQVLGDPTEAALLVLAAKAGDEANLVRQHYPRTAELPFTSERKRMTTVHHSVDGFFACSKGAPEVILASCTHELTPEGTRLFGPKDREAILEHAQALAADALRVLACAVRPVASSGPDLAEAENDMVFVGLVGMQDPPRPEVLEAIRTCHSAGIRPVMITGDHVSTAMSVARELGMLRHGVVLKGPELTKLTDAELFERVKTVDVFARISPEHKLRIVQAFLHNGDVVAMTGDGVNDAPALKQADIGVAMGITGTDVSKEASDMILTDDNFATIVEAVREGRSIFENIRKYLVYLFSGNMGAVFALVIALFTGYPLPLMAVQVLFINFIMDGLVAIALGVEPAEPHIMQRRPRSRREGMLNGETHWFIGVLGTWIGVSTFAVFALTLGSGAGTGRAVSLFFASLIAARLVNAFNCRTLRDSVFVRGRQGNAALQWSIGLTLLLSAAVIYIPFLHAPFGTVPLGVDDLLVVAAVGASVLVIGEIYKGVVRLLSRRAVLQGAASPLS